MTISNLKEFCADIDEIIKILCGVMSDNDDSSKIDNIKSTDFEIGINFLNRVKKYYSTGKNVMSDIALDGKTEHESIDNVVKAYKYKLFDIFLNDYSDYDDSDIYTDLDAFLSIEYLNYKTQCKYKDVDCLTVSESNLEKLREGKDLFNGVFNSNVYFSKFDGVKISITGLNCVTKNICRQTKYDYRIVISDDDQYPYYILNDNFNDVLNPGIAYAVKNHIEKMKRFNAYMTHHEYSIKQLANKMKVNESTIKRWKNGYFAIPQSVDHLIKEQGFQAL